MNIYALPLGTIITIIFIAGIVWMMIALCVQRYRKVWRALNGILAVMSFIVILSYTITNRSVGSSQTMPFIRTIAHIRQQPELIREMVMNAFLFFPFGLCLSYAIACVSDGKKSRPGLITIISALLLSGCIEFTQYLFNFGNCELSDIVMNTLGAAIGSVPYLLSSKRTRKVDGRR